ncbi:MAG TPA: hypothetical protein PK611_03655 [Saprospiraceae bacterium]|nr:hypothetical protein [Saprospiraceae bacterium]
MKTYLSIILVIIGFQLQAQFPFGGNKGPVIKGKVEGLIADSITNEALSFSSIALKKKGSSIALNGVLSDDKGYFKFTDVSNGSFDLYVSYVG